MEGRIFGGGLLILVSTVFGTYGTLRLGMAYHERDPTVWSGLALRGFFGVFIGAALAETAFHILR